VEERLPKQLVQFLDEEVTPRFPAGFTVVPAMGQYREAYSQAAKK
jgi:hypothetical protein